MLRVPRPAPKRCSPAAAAVASLSSTAGRPNAAARARRSARPSSPAGASGAMRTPRARVERPAAADPDGRDLLAVEAALDRAAARARTAAEPVARARARRPSARRRTRARAPAASTTPAASFVPPMSSPSTARSGAVVDGSVRPLATIPCVPGRDPADEVLLERGEEDHHRQDRAGASRP